MKAGAGFREPQSYSAFAADCESCAIQGTNCSDRCRDQYLVDPLSGKQHDYLGWLLSYEFLEERHVDHVEQGPELLVTSTVTDGRLPACVAEKTAEWLMGRPMTDADRPWLDELATDFVTSDFRYRELVKDILTSDNYRRAR